MSLPLEGIGKGVYQAIESVRWLILMFWFRFGADPYLSGEGAYETVMGIQSAGVQGQQLSGAHEYYCAQDKSATAKHYINNEQEHFRDSSSSNVDDRCEISLN